MSDQEHTLEELAREELSPAEVRTLLERLGQQEMGGTDAPTIGAVAEATNKTPAEIAELLAETRGEDFRRRFQSVLDQHESRIHRLEQGKHPMSNAVIKDYSHDAANFKLKHEESAKPLQLVLGLFVGIATVALVLYFRG